MSATIAQLGARVLRKLGVAIVANADTPAAGATVPLADVTARVARELGIVVPESARPAALVSVSQQEVAARALRSVNIDPNDSPALAPPTATFTTPQLARLVLLKLAVIASDETPSAEDEADAEQKVHSIHAELTQLDIAGWDGEAVPAHAVEHYVNMAADRLAAEFGKPSSAAVYVQAAEALRRQVLSGPAGQRIAESKVAAVHEALNVEGLVTWTLAGIPQAFAEDYVAMAAVLLGPVMNYVRSAPESATVYAATPAGSIPADAPNRQEDSSEWAAAIEHIRKAGMIAGLEARITQRIQSVHEELNASNLVTWTTAAIPAAVADAYAAMAVDMMGPEFGKPMDPAAWAGNMTRVRRVAMGGAAGQALAQQKIIAVHASMAARGKVRWTLHDLPVPAEEPYVLMAAVLLAPEVDAKADPSWWQVGEMDLCRVVALQSTGRAVLADYF